MSRFAQNAFAAVIAIAISAVTLTSVVSVPHTASVAIAAAPVLA